MADGFIVRRGGKATQQTIAPSILDFSAVSATEIKFKLRNNDAATATLVYRFGTLTGEGDSISLATNTTSSEITLTGLTLPGSLFVTANAVGKVKSEVAEEEFEVPIIYTAATGGTTNDYDLDSKRYRSHTFTSNGTFEVTTAGNGDRNQVDYLIIAGGGGGAGQNGGGGGAGGYLTTLGTSGGDSSAESKVTVTATSYGVTIGLGGAGEDGVRGLPGNSGTNSSVAFSPTITANGGGGGGAENNVTPSDGFGLNGGSGGGAARTQDSSGSATGGTGISTQGFRGGNTNDSRAAGGGGAGQQGQDADSTNNSTSASNGGNGLANLLRTGSNETRAGGGGGGSAGLTSIAATGGTGGGGIGGARTSNASNGTANTGSGGGGGGFEDENADLGGNGADGIVIIRYEIAPTV